MRLQGINHFSLQSFAKDKLRVQPKRMSHTAVNLAFLQSRRTQLKGIIDACRKYLTINIGYTVMSACV